MIEVLCRQSVDESVKPFIHPRIFSFVASDNHREPGVPKLMISHAPQSIARIIVTAKHHSGIFHSRDVTSDICCHRVWELKPFFRIVFNGAFDHFSRALPSIFLYTFNRVNAGGHCFLTARQIDSCSVPYKSSRRSPCNISCVLNLKFPGTTCLIRS